MKIEQSVNQARTAFEQGKFETAIHEWQAILALNTITTSQRIDTLLQLATTYQLMGASTQAQTMLTQALPLAENDTRHLPLILVALSDIALATRKNAQARDYANKSIAALSTDTMPLIRATALNNLGNVLYVEAYYKQAIENYTQSINFAKTAGDALLTARTLTNRAQAYLKNNQLREAALSLREAQQQLETLPNQYAKAFALISIGELAQRIQQVNPFLASPFASADQRIELRTIALTALKLSSTIAEKLQNSRLLSYSNGYLGQLYETEQQYTDALKLTRQAIFFAQQVNATEILYRWQWQLGRLLKTQQQTEAAIEAYQRAVTTLQSIRQELTIGYRSTSQSFREAVGSVYFELADLLLQRAATMTDKNGWLKQARDTIEQLKTAELQDYFQDDCVAPAPVKPTLLESGIARTAVIYPILLPNRIEILLSLPNSIEQFTIPVTANALKDEINEFRFELETRDTTAFLEYAQRLYKWLILPLEPALTAQQIETLVIVPDGVLRTIPLAALHDGKQFLITKYAVVTTPSLTLTESKAKPSDNYKILISGLSQSVQGYSELLSVPDEVQHLNNLYAQNATLLLDSTFTLDKFAEALKNTNYSIVHIASHAQFDSDPNKTFLLTYDGKLTVNRLEQLIRLSKLRNENMELLTLSACHTAIGDDQAALGLAGIALKAGAKSALASLWLIDDQATTQLVGEFYHQLSVEKVSKAKALQNAQKSLLEQSRYQHPAYWAPFLLIGNWL